MKNEQEFRKDKKPWPTKAAMEQVYDQHLWGGKEHDFYSGFGAHNPELVEPYIEVVKKFLDSFETPLTVCDLGCGDFNVGKELVDHSLKYIAIDIAENVIERNREKFSDGKLEFQCLNIAEHELPKGDCAILRHVLQHISNAEVKQIVDKLYKFKYVIFTDHIPVGEFEANKDIISGQGTRLKKKSGLDLKSAPFNFNIKAEKKLLYIPDEYGVMVTTLYTLP